MNTRYTSILLGIVAGLAPMIAQAVPISAASFYEEVTAYPIEKFGHSEGTLTLQESIQGRGSVDGWAKTTGGALPTASIDFYLSGHFPNGINGRAIATTSYSWLIEQIGGAPYYSTVPVIVTTKGDVSYEAVGDVDIGFLYAKAGFNWLSQYSEFKADLTNADGGSGNMSFDESFKKFVGIGNIYSVGLTAWGHADADDGESIHFSAYVDPLIIIDPTFARASDFRVVFSEGIGPIPLPATAWLFGSGLLGLVGATRRNRKIAA